MVPASPAPINVTLAPCQEPDRFLLPIKSTEPLPSTHHFPRPPWRIYWSPTWQSPIITIGISLIFKITLFVCVWGGGTYKPWLTQGGQRTTWASQPVSWPLGNTSIYHLTRLTFSIPPMLLSADSCYVAHTGLQFAFPLPQYPRC